MPKSKRPKFSLCKCRSHCTTFNTATGKYEGPGRWISRRTKDNHTLDDRRSRLSFDPHPSHNPLPLTTSPGASQGKYTLQHIQDELHLFMEWPVTSVKELLAFKNDPQAYGAYIPPTAADALWPNSGPFSLKEDEGVNAVYLTTEARFCEMVGQLNDASRHPKWKMSLLNQIYEGLADINRQKGIQWSQQRLPNGDSRAPAMVNTEPHFYRKGPYDKAARAASMLSLVLNHLYFIPQRALRTVLGGARTLVSIHARPEAADYIPKDPRTCTSSFDLEPQTTNFICCPSCHCLYSWEPGEESSKNSHCKSRRAPNSRPCGTSLWKEVRISGSRSTMVPIKKYAHQDLKSWLGRLLSRKGIETLIDSRPHSEAPGVPKVLDDIWLSKVFLELKDSNGQRFYPGPGNEGRLVFSLSVDSFDPLSGKAASQTVLSTGIWFVLLNLPWHLRHLPENVYLAGIMPGPKKPSMEEINSYMQLIVNEFLQFWDPGVFFSRTYEHRFGRLMKAMLVPIICDMLALRQIIGYSSSPNSHYMCPFCDLDIDDIDVLDRTLWPAKHLPDIKRFAELWRDAKSVEDRESISKAFGWRWSPLFSLPYFNPTQFAVVDSMHALHLGLVQHHCRSLFQIDFKEFGGDGLLNVPRSSHRKGALHLRNLRHCLDLIKENDESLLYQLLEQDRVTLHAVCSHFSIHEIHSRSLVIGTKWPLSKNIYAWRQRLRDTGILEDDGLAMAILHALNNENEAKGLTGVDGSAESEYHRQDGSSEDEDSGEEVVQVEDEESDGEEEDDSKDDRNEDEEEGDSEEDQEEDDEEEDEDGELPDQGTPASVSEEGIESEWEALDEFPQQKPQQVRRVLRNLLGKGGDRRDLVARRKMAYKAANRNLYVQIAALLSLNIPEKSSKSVFHKSVVDAIDENERLFTILEEYLEIRIRRSSLHGAVLGKDVMCRVWSDMGRCQLPTWVTPVPPNWGTRTRGKLSADNWRVICIVHLPVTLIWLWRDEQGRKRELLNNFMDLAIAVRIANMRVCSPAHIEAYDNHVLRYIQGLTALFPHSPLLPNHHAALHIRDGLARFGPGHSHGSSFYERYIAFFHRININNKPGQLEASLLRAAMRFANLRSILECDLDIRESVAELIETMEAINQQDLRGHRLANLLDPTDTGFKISEKGTPSPLPHNEYDLLCDLLRSRQLTRPMTNDMVSVLRVSLSGLCYGIFDSPYFRDSSVLFHLTNGNGEVTQGAGTIERIFCHRIEQPRGLDNWYLTVREHVVLDRLGFVDPYLRYNLAGGYLCEEAATVTRVVRLPQIICHFVMTAIPEAKAIHVMPLHQASEPPIPSTETNPVVL